MQQLGRWVDKQDKEPYELILIRLFDELRDIVRILVDLRILTLPLLQYYKGAIHILCMGGSIETLDCFIKSTT